MRILLLILLMSTSHAVERIAHRGAPFFAPENTMSSFRQALELKSDYLETDVRLTADGVFVLMHDEEVDRTTSGSGKVSELTFEQLSRLDAGKGEKVPKLEELLALARANPSVKLILELKDGDDERPGTEKKFVDAVRKSGLKGRVLFTSFSWPALQRLRALAPEVPQIYVYFASLPDWGLTFDSFFRFHSPLDLNVEFLEPHGRLTSKEFVKAAHARGKKVLLWGLDELEDMKSWVELKPDGIETDRLDLLNCLLSKNC